MHEEAAKDEASAWGSEATLAGPGTFLVLFQFQNPRRLKTTKRTTLLSNMTSRIVITNRHVLSSSSSLICPSSANASSFNPVKKILLLQEISTPELMAS